MAYEHINYIEDLKKMHTNIEELMKNKNNIKFEIKKKNKLWRKEEKDQRSSTPACAINY